MEPSPPDDGLSDFVLAGDRLFGIACRMLGSTEVRDAPAFLATITSRVAINAMKSARSRREVYVCALLLEPTDTSADPESRAEQDEALELAVHSPARRRSKAERVSP